MFPFGCNTSEIQPENAKKKDSGTNCPTAWNSVGSLLLVFFPATNQTLEIKMSDRNNSVLLLWWTPWPWWGRQEELLAETCLATHGFHCNITHDHGRMDEADAVIFVGTAMNKSNILPVSTRLGKRWVYYNLESPLNSHDRLGDFGNVFHWTMTYRKNSNIPFPYGFTSHAENTFPNLSPKNRSKLVAWMVSNCSPISRRQDIVKEMQAFIPIDIYGDCGNLTLNCPKPEFQKPVTCYALLAKQYKFFLAFENSLCVDYVTEKAWEPLKVGMIPIVYGGADYFSLLPPNSFIDITRFKSIKDLSEYIFYLDKNEHEYLKYFEWRRRYRIEDRNGYCTLCRRILEERFAQEKENTVHPDILSIRHGFKGEKREVPDFLWKYIEKISDARIPACDLFRSSKYKNAKSGN